MLFRMVLALKVWCTDLSEHVQYFQPGCTMEDFWAYLETFAEEKVHDKGAESVWFSDETSVRLGSVRLRQLRVLPGLVLHSFEKQYWWKRLMNTAQVFE